MFNFFNQRRPWDDLIIVFLRCGCSGAGLSISAAMAMTLVAWRLFRRESVEESRDCLLPNTTTKDLPPCCRAPECTFERNATASEIPASVD
jgi:uncharacterized protein (TIGR03382 family)